MSEDGKRVVGVSALAAYIKRMISQSKVLAGTRVRGEVSGLSQKNGRLYFSLKEHADLLKCVVWAEAVPKLPPLQNGVEIVVDGAFDAYGPQSQYQLHVEAVELSGTGYLYAQFEALKAQFRAEGLFEPGRKRPMPAFPQRVALISARGKGAEDFLTTMAQRAPHVAIQFVETRVQGDGAQMDIGEAIDRASRLEVDAIVLARGGGSYEDLFPFNLEPVVRAILRARYPVLTAIGHTGDRHLADEVADSVAETPSNAAQYFGRIRDAALRRVEQLETRLDAGLRNVAREQAQRFDALTDRLDRCATGFVSSRMQRLLVLERRIDERTPVARLAHRSARLTTAVTSLNALGPSKVKDAERRVHVLAAHLDGHDPYRPLQRGYAMVYSDGALLRDAARVKPGMSIEARLQHGRITARVEGSASDE